MNGWIYATHLCNEITVITLIVKVYRRMDDSFDPCSSNDREGETLIERETTFSRRISRLQNKYACDLLSSSGGDCR